MKSSPFKSSARMLGTEASPLITGEPTAPPAPAAIPMSRSVIPQEREPPASTPLRIAPRPIRREPRLTPQPETFSKRRVHAVVPDGRQLPCGARREGGRARACPKARTRRRLTAAARSRFSFLNWTRVKSESSTVFNKHERDRNRLMGRQPMLYASNVREAREVLSSRV